MQSQATTSSDKINPINPILVPKTHLKTVEAAVGLENEILGVLQRVNVAVLDDEVAQVLCLCREAVATWKLRAEAKGSSSILAPQTPAVLTALRLRSEDSGS